jgi:hypothetical protein
VGRPPEHGSGRRRNRSIVRSVAKHCVAAAAWDEKYPKRWSALPVETAPSDAPISTNGRGMLSDRTRHDTLPRMVAKKTSARTVEPPFVGTALMAHAQDTRHLKSLLEEVQALIDAR